MAQVEKTVVQGEKIVVTEVPGYQLTLDEDEALSLALVLGKVGGLERTRRGHTQAILDQLREVGVPWHRFYMNPDVAPTGNIYFG